MTSSDVLELLQLVDEASIGLWLDGGWGVDALLETQTRPHHDVDVILRVQEVPRFQDLLERKGFGFREGVPPTTFVLADGSGREIDVHAVAFDAEGNGVYRMENGDDWIFPAEGFSGHGVIAGHRVACLSPATQMLCHAHGYEPGETDFRDMELLHERFGLEIPPQLQRRST